MTDRRLLLSSSLPALFSLSLSLLSVALASVVGGEHARAREQEFAGRWRETKKYPGKKEEEGSA